jgi:hypothetical protein
LFGWGTRMSSVERATARDRRVRTAVRTSSKSLALLMPVARATRAARASQAFDRFPSSRPISREVRRAMPVVEGAAARARPLRRTRRRATAGPRRPLRYRRGSRSTCQRPRRRAILAKASSAVIVDACPNCNASSRRSSSASHSVAASGSAGPSRLVSSSLARSARASAANQ